MLSYLALVGRVFGGIQVLASDVPVSSGISHPGVITGQPSAGAFLSAIYNTPNACKIGNAANKTKDANKNPYTMFVNIPAVT